MDRPARSRWTMPAMSPTTVSISNSVVPRPRESRIEPAASSREWPRARRTCEISREPVAERREPGRFVRNSGPGQLEGASHPHDPGNVFRPRPSTAFLASSMDQGCQANAAAHQQGAYSLGPVELMGGKGDQIGL